MLYVIVHEDNLTYVTPPGSARSYEVHEQLMAMCVRYNNTYTKGNVFGVSGLGLV